MNKKELTNALFWSVFGISLIVIGSLWIGYQFLISAMTKRVHKQLSLAEGTVNYEVWRTPVNLVFRCYLFNVTNPEGVMEGEYPNLVEHGPFTYQETLEKQVIDVDEENDEIIYTTRSAFKFLKRESLVVTTRDKISIINPAYIGTIETLAGLPPSFLKQYGDNIPKLFPNPKSIFLTAKAPDLLFNGVKITCNLKKYPELSLICQTLKAKAPPILRATDKEDVYLFSFFQKLNNTLRGPFTVNRGTKNITKLGDITSFKGDRIQKMWNTDECNKVRGTDTITWAPLTKAESTVTTFSPDLCRAIDIDYVNEVSVSGMMGFRFVMKERVWSKNESECFCPMVNGKMECLPTGLLDLNKCQEGPVYLSEPHFLHGDPSLLKFARGLQPVESRHETYIIINPISGSPLSGQKRTQFNLKLSNQPVDLLKNVSDGFFPLFWCESGNTPKLNIIRGTYQLHRLYQVVWFMQCLPVIVGVYIVLAVLFFYCTPQHKVELENQDADSILITSSFSNANQHVVRRPPIKPIRTWE